MIAVRNLQTRGALGGHKNCGLSDFQLTLKGHVHYACRSDIEIGFQNKTVSNLGSLRVAAT